MIRRLITRKTIIAMIVFILLAATSGVIGNAMYAVFIWLWENAIKPLWEQVTKSVMAGSWPLIITSATSLIGISGSIFLWNRSKVLNSALNTTHDLIELDDSLLRLLESLVSANDLKVQMRRLLEELLRDAIRTFPGDVYRASLLLPDAGEEYLQIRVSYQMPEESVNRTKFYIGKEENRKSERGIAGATYLDGQLRVGHMIQENAHWKCDHEGYINFDSKRPHPSYYSFVCVPIIGLNPGSAKGNTISCLGVVCFDSHSAIVFDSPQIQELLLTFGSRIAAALTIYIQLLLLRGLSST